MIIIYGTRAYGRTDSVPGLFYVSTMFFYLYWIPLIPYRSVVMIDDGGDRGVSVGLSLKSVLFGYLRTAALIAMVVCGIGAILSVTSLFGDPKYRSVHVRGLAITAAVTVGAFAIYKATRMRALDRPSYGRAMQLADALGLTDEGRILLDAAYDRVTEDEARRALEKLAKQGDPEPERAAAPRKAARRASSE